jgi:hypothetical protein
MYIQFKLIAEKLQSYHNLLMVYKTWREVDKIVWLHADDAGKVELPFL